MKVYLDEDLSPRIAQALRRQGVDATSAQEAGATQLDDGAQLAFATHEGRAIVTANVRDFLRLARHAVATNTVHAGIVLVPASFRRDEFSAIARAVHDALKAYPRGLAGLVLYVRRR